MNEIKNVLFITTTNKKIALGLILYGAFLILAGLAGYVSNPEKAKTALMSGGMFGALSILLGILEMRGFSWSKMVAQATTGFLVLIFTWRSTVGWLAVIDGKSEKLFAAALISLMLMASVAMLVVLLKERARGQGNTAS
jgi:uncharacterized membrane protein (UPF0136 family)